MSEFTMEQAPEPAPKQKREVSPEQRQRLAQQLAKGRATAAANRAAGKTSNKKTAADVRNAPGPRPSERADPAREDMSRIPTRRRREERDTGMFTVPEYLKKPGWDYQFVPIRVLNEPVDGSFLRSFREGGWQSVLAGDNDGRFMEMADDGQGANTPIEIGAQRLYTRPMRLTREAQQEDLNAALTQQRDKMKATVDGTEEGLRQRGAVRPVGGSVTIEGVAG